MTIAQARKLNDGDNIFCPVDKWAIPPILRKGKPERKMAKVIGDAHKTSKLHMNIHKVKFVWVNTNQGVFPSHRI